MHPSDSLDALSRLSSRLAHDLSNYLYVVSSAVELLSRMPGLDPQARAVIEMLQRNTGQAGDLMERLLAFSGSRPLRPEPLDLRVLGAGIAARLRQELEPKVVVESDFAADCRLVYADREALEAALLALAENAREAMPEGGRFAIRAGNVADEVVVSVSDSGRGMTPEVAARACEPFFTTREAPAEGLGLSQVYGFVRQCGGRVELESEPGAGTRVKIFFPRMTRRPRAERPGAQLEDLHVLLIEDEALISMLAEDLLGQLGCKVIGAASTVDQALALARDADIDLAVLDVNLRGEPAYPVADALQARGVPFVFVSAYGEVDLPWRDRPMVHKPIELGRLKREIERALERG